MALSSIIPNDPQLAERLRRIARGIYAATPQRQVSADYTVQETDRDIYVDATAGDVDIQLPRVAQWYGRDLTVTRVDGSLYHVYITPYGSETISGAAQVDSGNGATSEWDSWTLRGTPWYDWVVVRNVDV